MITFRQFLYQHIFWQYFTLSGLHFLRRTITIIHILDYLWKGLFNHQDLFEIPETMGNQLNINEICEMTKLSLNALIKCKSKVTCITSVNIDKCIYNLDEYNRRNFSSWAYLSILIKSIEVYFHD
jgi:hypothetical protein